jgi:mono/diheme cytochrome c family protein
MRRTEERDRQFPVFDWKCEVSGQELYRASEIWLSYAVKLQCDGSGSNSATHHDNERIKATTMAAVMLATIAFLNAPAKADEKTAALYKQKCTACHGVDGKGETPTGKAMKVRSFADPEVAKMSDDELAAAIEKGKGKMPAYGKSLKPDEIKAMVAYVRSLAK